MIFQVFGEKAENSVRIASNVRRLGEVIAEPVDSHADGPSRLLGGVNGPEAVLLLVPVQGLKVALDLAPYGFDKLGVFEDGLQLALGAESCAHELRIVKGQGQSLTRRYWHEQLGFNYRMTNIAAAIGFAQSERLPQILARKRKVSRTQIERLQAGRERLIDSYEIVQRTLDEARKHVSEQHYEEALVLYD